MPRIARRRALTGALRRDAKRRKSSDTRWMHLSCAEVKNRSTLQRITGVHLLGLLSSSVHVRKLLLLLHLLRHQWNGTEHQIDVVITALRLSHINMLLYLRYVKSWFYLDAFLHDITPFEIERARALTVRRNIRLASWDDAQCYHYTGFRAQQLQKIYACFGLNNILIATQLPYIQVPSRHTNQRGVACFYNFDPEELFLFTLTKCRSGRSNLDMCVDVFGGHHLRWSNGFPWMLLYLDNRYRSIIGHEGLIRYVPQFPYFHHAIERELQRPKTHYDVEGNAIESNGLRFNPFNIALLVDGSHDGCCVPYSGPAGDYEFAPRKMQYEIAQRAFYSGYKHFHSIKVETVAMPNGITTTYGPVSGRGSDITTVRESGLDNFLRIIQQNMPETYMALGDLIYNAQFLTCIRSYFIALGPGVVLSEEEREVNRELQWIRQEIEYYFGEVSCLFKICSDRSSYKLAKEHPYVVEQLRVCHLLTNIYNCLNGDKFSNKLGVQTPRLEDYLRL